MEYASYEIEWCGWSSENWFITQTVNVTKTQHVANFFQIECNTKTWCWTKLSIKPLEFNVIRLAGCELHGVPVVAVWLFASVLRHTELGEWMPRLEKIPLQGFGASSMSFWFPMSRAVWRRSRIDSYHRWLLYERSSYTFILIQNRSDRKSENNTWAHFQVQGLSAEDVNPIN